MINSGEFPMTPLSVIKLSPYGVPRKLDQRKRAAYYARCKKEGDYEQALQQ
jgi:hypothetical protein